ncbi:MAG: hypothetical protein AAF560_19660, partial [Acidobacteriota bacterium]
TAPGERGRLALPKALGAAAADAVRWTAFDPMGREVSNWTLPQRDLRAELVAEQQSIPSQSAEAVVAEAAVAEAVVDGPRLSLRAGDHGAVFDLESGELLRLSHRDRELSLARGLRVVGGSEPGGAQVRHEVVDEVATVDVSYRAQESAAHRLDRARWTLYPSGWLRLAVTYVAEGPHELLGFGFDYPRQRVVSLSWLGGGPGRVWKNRLAGAALGVWRKSADLTPVTAAHEPKLEGFYRDVVWARLETDEGYLTLVPEADQYLSLFSPPFPEDARDAVATVPESGIHFLHGISAIGTKFWPAADLGPDSWINEGQGTYEAVVWLRVDAVADPTLDDSVDESAISMPEDAVFQ